MAIQIIIMCAPARWSGLVATHAPAYVGLPSQPKMRASRPSPRRGWRVDSHTEWKENCDSVTMPNHANQEASMKKNG